LLHELGHATVLAENGEQRLQGLKKKVLTLF